VSNCRCRSAKHGSMYRLDHSNVDRSACDAHSGWISTPALQPPIHARQTSDAAPTSAPNPARAACPAQGWFAANKTGPHPPNPLRLPQAQISPPGTSPQRQRSWRSVHVVSRQSGGIISRSTRVAHRDHRQHHQTTENTDPALKHAHVTSIESI